MLIGRIKIIKLSLYVLFLCSFSAFTADNVSAQVNTDSGGKTKLDFSQFIGPDDCLGVTQFADPYVLR